MIAPDDSTILINGRMSTLFRPDSIKASKLPSAIEQKLYASEAVVLKPL